jgi:hypothetical protein
MWGMLEGIEGLRQAGDRVYFEADRDPAQASGYLEVIASEYSVNRSELIVREYVRKNGNTTIYLFRADLCSGSPLLYEIIMHGPDGETSIQKATLNR